MFLWVDSFFNHSSAQVHLGSGNIIVAQHVSRMGVIVTQGAAASTDSHFIREKVASQEGTPRIFFPRPLYNVEDLSSPGRTGSQYNLVLPHWLLIAVWFVLFLVALDVRQKILQEKTELPPEDAPNRDTHDH